VSINDSLFSLLAEISPFYFSLTPDLSPRVTLVTAKKQNSCIARARNARVSKKIVTLPNGWQGGIRVTSSLQICLGLVELQFEGEK